MKVYLKFLEVWTGVVSIILFLIIVDYFLRKDVQWGTLQSLMVDGVCLGIALFTDPQSDHWWTISAKKLEKWTRQLAEPGYVQWCWMYWNRTSGCLMYIPRQLKSVEVDSPKKDLRIRIRKGVLFFKIMGDKQLNTSIRLYDSVFLPTVTNTSAS